MNEVPAKVYAVIGAEAAAFVGFGIFLFHTVRVVVTATKNGSWGGFRSL